MSAECVCRWVDEPEVNASWLAAENPACPEHGPMISDGVWFEGKWYPRVQCQRRGTKSQLGREMT